MQLDEIWQSIWQLVDENPWAAGVLTGLLVVVLAWVVGLLRKRQRARAVLQVLNDSGRGRLTPRRGPGPGGFVAEMRPPPEPYRWFWVEYRPLSMLAADDLIARLLGGRRELLVLRADLPERPGAELVWMRGQKPGRALGKGPGGGLWMSHRLDFLNTEYATRGTYTSALVHAFRDLQTRFGPFVQRFRIQGDENPEVEVVVRMSGLNVEELPALILMLRTAGRAAMQR